MQVGPGTSLAELAECLAALGEAGTLTQLGEGPFLLVYPWEDRGVNLFDTARIGDEPTELCVRGLRHTIKGRAERARPVTNDPFLVPVIKSTRNPFSQLITLGRARNNDLIINSPNISKVHAWFLDGGPSGWFIQDNGSTNGTSCNDEPATKGNNVSLRFGDMVSFGGVEAVFVDAQGVVELAESRY